MEHPMSVTQNLTTEPAGAWIRVSSGGQDEQSQVPDLENWAGARSYDVAARYVIHGKSAFKGNRKFDQAWQQVIEDMKSGKIRVLLVWKQDRLDRKLQTFQMLAEVLDAGGRVEFVTQPHLNDLTQMGNRIALKVQEEIAHQESADKSDRVRIKHAALRGADSLIGRPAWGQQVVKLPDGRKTLALTGTGRACAEKIYLRTAAGESTAAIACWLDSAYLKAGGGLLGIGVPPAQLRDTGPEPGRLSACPRGGSWWPRVVGQLIRNPAYMGRRTDAEHRVHRCEAAVSAELWNAANARLDALPSRRGPDTGHRAMLTSVIFCAECGGPMYRTWCGTGRHRVAYYRCHGAGAGRKGCGAPMVRLDLADAAVCEIAETTFRYHRITVTRFVPGTGHEAELAEIAADIAQLGADFAAERVSLDKYQARFAELVAERKRLKAAPASPDRREDAELEDTYADRWSAIEPSGRGPWLLANGFRIEASRDALTLSQPGHPRQVTATVALTREKAAA